MRRPPHTPTFLRRFSHTHAHTKNTHTIAQHPWQRRGHQARGVRAAQSGGRGDTAGAAGPAAEEARQPGEGPGGVPLAAGDSGRPASLLRATFGGTLCMQRPRQPSTTHQHQRTEAATSAGPARPRGGGPQRQALHDRVPARPQPAWPGGQRLRGLRPPPRLGWRWDGGGVCEEAAADAAADGPELLQLGDAPRDVQPDAQLSGGVWQGCGAGLERVRELAGVGGWVGAADYRAPTKGSNCDTTCTRQTATCTRKQVIAEGVRGLVFKNKRDRKVIDVDPKAPPGESSVRSELPTDEYMQVVIYDHVTRRRG